jgi:hypothetical protein
MRAGGVLRARAGRPSTALPAPLPARAQLVLRPSIWDLIVWVNPNPNGAFADKNPLVKP